MTRPDLACLALDLLVLFVAFLAGAWAGLAAGREQAAEQLRKAKRERVKLLASLDTLREALSSGAAGRRGAASSALHHLLVRAEESGVYGLIAETEVEEGDRP